MTDQYAELRSRIGAAITRIISGKGAMRVPADPTDPDVVLSDCQDTIRALLAERDTARSRAESLADQVRRDYEQISSVFAERDALAQDAARCAVTLSVAALREALTLADPDGDEEPDAEVTIEWMPERTSINGKQMPAGYYLYHHMTCPEEEVMGPLGAGREEA